MATWSAVPPSVEGRFWMKPEHGATDIVNVVLDDAFNRLGFQTFGDSFIWRLDRFVGALWLGPLEPPAFEQAAN